MLSLSVVVTNTGSLNGDDSVLLFVVPPNAGQGRLQPACASVLALSYGVVFAALSDGNPIKYLAGFERINLNPGQSQNVTFDLSALTFGIADVNGLSPLMLQ